MARLPLPLVELAGFPQHVIQRGNNRQACFASIAFAIDGNEFRVRGELSPEMGKAYTESEIADAIIDLLGENISIVICVSY